MKGGAKLYNQINEAIKLHDKLLLIISENSMKSPWVTTEIKKVLSREKLENRQSLFPISIASLELLKNWELFDADLGVDIASEIRSYHVIDFSNWENADDYIVAFDKLMESLKGLRI